MSVPHIHISKWCSRWPNSAPQLSGAATIACSLGALASLREDLGLRGNGAFAPESWVPSARRPYPVFSIRGLFPNGRGLPLLQSHLLRGFVASCEVFGFCSFDPRGSDSLAKTPESNQKLFFGLQVAQNFSSEEFVDFLVPRNRLCHASLWVVVDIMLGSMAQQDCSSRFHFGNQVAPLHTNSNSSTFRIPGITSAVKVSCRSRRCSFKS